MNRELTSAEANELQQLRSLIEKAVADGRLTADEMARIRTVARADCKITFAELELYRTLIQEKIQRGELIKDWD